MKKILLSVSLMFLFQCSFSQELPNIVPPNPEASSLAKFIETPVSHYTGTANITIPIYTIKEKDVEIPVSLNYHTRGIKVEEIASRVGLGWALSYGGFMSRQIRGKADESSYGYFKNSSNFKTFFSNLNTRVNVKQTYELYQDYDHFPDKFLINVNDVSGSFVYDYNDDKPVLKRYKDLQVETIWNSTNANNSFKISGFIITDKQGIKYYFGLSADGNRSAISNSRVTNVGTYSDGVININSSDSDFYPNSWQLMDIITPAGTHIKFYYSLQDSAYYSRGYDKSEKIGKVTSFFNKVINNEYQLKEIHFSEGKLIFNSSNIPRGDIDGYYLDNIILIDNHEKKIKETKLNYEYTEAPDSKNQLQRLIQLEPKANKRLFLKSIVTKNSQDVSIPPYEFAYNKQMLPSRFSTSQDIWGNYNGKDNGSQISFFNDNNNRSVDTIKSQAGMLEQIKYPTGGKTKITYEHNRGFFASNSASVIMESPNPISKKTLSLTRKDFTYNNGEYKSKNLTIPIKNSTKLSVFCHHFSDSNTQVTYPDCIFDFSMITDYKPNYRYQLKIGSYQSFPYPVFSPSTGNVTFFASPKTISGLDNPHKNEQYDFELRIEYEEQQSVREVAFAEGKRIKKIEKYDSNDELVIEKEYSYKLGSKSSGFINGFPHFVSKDKNGYIVRWGNLPGSPLNTFQGNSISYSSVTEYAGSQEVNSGKKEYNFTFTGDAGAYFEFPYHIPNDMEWLRGKPLTIKYYKKKNNDYKLLKTIKNNYLYGNSLGDQLGSLFISSNFIFKPNSVVLPLNTSLTNPNYIYTKNKTLFRMPLFRFTKLDGKIAYKIYSVTGGTVDLLNTEEINYHDSGELKSKITYFYDYANHYQLLSSEFICSNGSKLRTTNTFDSKLMSKNRMIPVKTEVFKDDIKLREQKTVYASDHNSTNLYLPKEIQTLKGFSSLTNKFESRVVYHSYDDKGNPLELSKKDGTKIYYVWGYHQTYPIVKIVGYTDTQLANVQTLINTAISKSNLDKDLESEKVLRKALNTLRTKLPNSQVTTYTCDPLIGLTSITDPRGETIYYEYDAFNRLQYVKDSKGNILKEHKYKYKN